MNTFEVRAIAYLQYRIMAGWLRRSVRSVFFWVVAAAISLLILGQIGSAVQGATSPGGVDWLTESHRSAAAAVMLLAAVVIGLWRGTSTTPAASLADVVVLMGSPISSRIQFGYLMAKPALTNAGIFGFWTLVGTGGAMAPLGDPWIGIRLFAGVVLIVLLSEFLRFAVWSSTERVIVGSPAAGQRLRSVLRAGTVLGSAALFAWMFTPVLRGEADDWRAILNLAVERGEQLAAVPPMSLLAGVATQAGSSVPGALGLTLFTFVIGAVALVSARDFAEPVSVTAERKTDSRGHLVEAGSDVQWATLSQFGVSPGMSVTVRPFGRGAWAILWAGTVRWFRYQIAAMWISLLLIAMFGVLAALAVNLGLFHPVGGWGVALTFPFLGSINMFLDEMRKPFIFLVPGSPGARLLAGAIPSSLDGLSATMVIALILGIFGAVPVEQAAGLILLGAAISFLAQASVATVQLLLPYWVGYRVRMSVTLPVTGIAFLPTLIVIVLTYFLISPLIALLVGATASFITGAIMFLVATLLFDYVEHSE